MTLDWDSFKTAAQAVAPAGRLAGGRELVGFRSRLVEMVEEVSGAVERVSDLPATPPAELLVVDRWGWIGGNLRTLQRVFGGLDVSGLQARVLAWEGGAVIGLLARAVLAQYDPFRDQLIVVYPNLGELSDDDGLRWLVLHEVTHVAQFRAAPWITDRLAEAGRLLVGPQPGWTREALRRLGTLAPDIVRWLRASLEGRPREASPLLDLLPDAQRRAILEVNAIVTLLEGHATHVTELAARPLLRDYEGLVRRIEARRRRPPLVRLLEAVGGIEMKRQQYLLGRDFCRYVWSQGGAAALAPAWRGPEWAPLHDELREPQRWLDRVGARSSA